MFYEIKSRIKSAKMQGKSAESGREKIYGRQAWKKNSEKDREKVGKDTVKPSLPKFTSSIRDFADVLDSLIVDYDIEMVVYISSVAYITNHLCVISN